MQPLVTVLFSATEPPAQKLVGPPTEIDTEGGVVTPMVTVTVREVVQEFALVTLTV
jgi:hypothetical protein